MRRLRHPAVLGAIMLATIAAVELHVSVASAQSEPRSAPIVLPAAGPRFRFGFGGSAGFGMSGAGIGAGGLGASLRLGVQLNDRIAVYANGQFTSAMVTHALLAGVMMDLTPIPLLSLGLGVGMNWSMENAALRNRGGSYMGIGFPLRVAFNFGRADYTPPVRHRFYVSIDGFVGGTTYVESLPTVSSAAVSYFVGMGFGYERM